MSETETDRPAAAGATEGAAMLPLSGMRVIELTHAWAGPLCGMMLADMGAEVVKVEAPDQTSEARGGFPYEHGESVIFMMTHRNKKSITLDLKSERGRKVFLDLVRNSDVLIQNLRPGVLKRLHLDYEDLKAVNPALIFTSVSGYGPVGPDAGRAGVDQVAIATSGLAATTMADATSPPVALGTPVCDFVAAMWACHGTLCAYVWRQHSGLGQRVEASLLEAGLGLMIAPTAMHFHTPGYTGLKKSMNGPSEFLLCADGRFVSLFASYPALWDRFVDAMQTPELTDEPLFATREGRTAHAPRLRAILRRHFAMHESAHWVSLLRRAGVPAAVVNTIGDALQDPQVAATGMLQDTEHPTAGRVRVLGVPVKLSATPGTVRTAAPLLGADTDEVLRTLGMSEAEVANLREASVIGPRPPAPA